MFSVLCLTLTPDVFVNDRWVETGVLPPRLKCFPGKYLPHSSFAGARPLCGGRACACRTRLGERVYGCGVSA